jgi:hypothetical protein
VPWLILGCRPMMSPRLISIEKILLEFLSDLGHLLDIHAQQQVSGEQGLWNLKDYLIRP